MQYLRVGKVGIEPTCNQLPFLLLIRRRGYIPIYSVRPERLERSLLTEYAPKAYGSTQFPQGRNFSNIEDVNPLGCSHLATSTTCLHKQHQIMFEIYLALKGAFVIGISRTNFQMTTCIIPGMHQFFDFVPPCQRSQLK